MELSFNELKKRDVINISDGRCLGRITDLKLCFPEGILVGISVPGKKAKGIFRIFDKSEIFIDVNKIIKIGGDVILVGDIVKIIILNADIACPKLAVDPGGVTSRSDMRADAKRTAADIRKGAALDS